MEAGSALRFRTYIELQYSGQKLTFYVNGRPYKVFDGRDDIYTFFDYVYMADEAGEYTFKWEARVSDPASVCLDDVEYISDPCDEDLSAALNDGGSIPFMRYGCDSITVEQSDGRDYAETTGPYCPNWRGYIATPYIELEAGDAICFDYYINESDNSVSYFSFGVNGEYDFFVPALDGDSCWHTYTYPVTTAGRYSFTWMFWMRAVKYPLTRLRLDNMRIVPGGAVERPSLDEVLNVPGGNLHFESSGSSAFTVEQLFGQTYAVAHHDYEHYSLAILTTTVELRKNHVFSFDYLSCQPRYNYGITFYINGSKAFDTYNLGKYGWRRYTFTAPEDGVYTMKWECKTPNQETEHNIFPTQDRLARVQVDPPQNAGLHDALNVEGGRLDFFENGYLGALQARQEGDRYFADFAPQGAGSVSVALYTRYLHLRQGQKITFEYNVDALTTYNSHLAFRVNNTVVLDLKSTPTETGWQRFTFTIPREDDYFFRWDFSTQNNERLMLDDIEVIGGIPIAAEPGDADKNGVIDTADALLVLRAALGIDGDPAALLTVCDMDGNGIIDTTDALLILRLALGIS
jgi:hypothetical protein